VARIAAEDRRVAAAISQVPYTDGIAALRAAGPADIWRMGVAGLRDELAHLRGREPHRIPIVGRPGSTAMMNSPDAEPGYCGMFEPGAPFRNEVAARVALRIAFYSPGRAARRIACPWLVCVADGDVVTPPQPAIKAAMSAPRGELRRYESGHFDIYRGELFERATRDQIDFIRRSVRVTQPPRATPRPRAGRRGRSRPCGHAPRRSRARGPSASARARAARSPRQARARDPGS
jgi:hypothetical protein